MAAIFVYLMHKCHNYDTGSICRDLIKEDTSDIKMVQLSKKEKKKKENLRNSFHLLCVL